MYSNNKERIKKVLLKKNKSLILIEIADEKFEKVNKYLSEKNFRIIFKSKYRLDYVYSNLLLYLWKAHS